MYISRSLIPRPLTRTSSKKDERSPHGNFGVDEERGM